MGYNRSSHITGRLAGLSCEQFACIAVLLLDREGEGEREREKSSRRALLVQAEAHAKCQAGDTNDKRNMKRHDSEKEPRSMKHET